MAKSSKSAGFFKLSIAGNSVNDEEEANMATSVQMWEILDFTNFNVISWI